MTRGDFTFLGKGEPWITEDHDLNTSKVRHLTCEWRHQKNNDNGQSITFSGDSSNRSYCIVDAGLRIYHRSKRLGMKDSESMTVYAVKGETLLREAAQEVLGLQKSDPVVKKWPTHSMRVTAADLLHRMQLSNSYIQKRLRWNSDRFLMYLRNTIHAVDAHTKAITVKMSQRELQTASYRPAEPHEVMYWAGAAAA